MWQPQHTRMALRRVELSGSSCGYKNKSSREQGCWCQRETCAEVGTGAWMSLLLSLLLPASWCGGIASAPCFSLGKCLPPSPPSAKAPFHTANHFFPITRCAVITQVGNLYFHCVPPSPPPPPPPLQKRVFKLRRSQCCSSAIRCLCVLQGARAGGHSWYTEVTGLEQELELELEQHRSLATHCSMSVFLMNAPLV